MWRIIRVYYYDEQKNPLILDCVRPLLGHLQEEGLIDQASFSRGWPQGPHVRLYVRSDPSHWQAVQDEVRVALSSYLTDHPSTLVLREEDVRAEYERLATVEGVTGPLFPLRPDNSVHFEEDDTDLAIYGGEVAIELARLFLSRSMPIAFELLERVRERPSELLSQMFACMLLTSSSLDDLQRSYISYRSHSEGLLNGYDRRGTLRRQFDRQYEERAEALQRMVQPYLASPSYRANDLEEQWGQVLADFVPQLRETVYADLIHMSSPLVPDPSVGSAFHQFAYNLPWAQKYLLSHNFTVRRFLLNMMYEFMLQCGVRPIEKIYLCYMVVRTIEGATGVTWEELMKAAEGKNVV